MSKSDLLCHLFPVHCPVLAELTLLIQTHYKETGALVCFKTAKSFTFFSTSAIHMMNVSNRALL